jgi:predicted nuclease of predicted toxin-antitoxin system
MTTIWVDAHLSPAIATWIIDTFGVTAVALRDLGLRDAEDPEMDTTGLEPVTPTM